ncbi:putative Rep [uncultured virus]|uniref:Putative Rep n=1 Tax=uncultured virus TaxID=340016 RepID=A0A2K9LSA7_9VIRU|nr:putative Rep [uncultured virus]
MVYDIPCKEYNMPIRVSGMSRQAYLRKLRRRRIGRVKRLGGRKGALKRMVQKMISRNQETKYVATNLDASGNDMGPLWYVKPIFTALGDVKPAVPVLTEGTGDYQRVGSKVRPVKCSVSIKASFQGYDLSANELMCVIYYGTDKANKTWQGGNIPLQTSSILNKGDGTNKQWTGLLSDLNYPVDKNLFNLKRKVFRLSKTGGNLNSDIGGSNNGAFSTSNGRSEFSTLLRFKAPKTLIYNNDVDTYPSNWGPFYYIGFCHADGSGLTMYDSKLVNVASRCHMWYKDA